MRVIARSTLSGFVKKRVERRLRASVKSHLDAWYSEAAKATWTTSAELKQQYRSASVISSSRVVFNIKGNEYRLIVDINYAFQILFLTWLGTHLEYDKIDAEQVSYDKERYAHTSSAD